MAGIVSIMVGFAAPMALSALAFGSYLHGLFPGVQPLAASVAVVVLVSLIHLHDLRLSSVFQIFFTGLKIALVLFLIAAFFNAPASTPSAAAPWTDYMLTAPFAVSLMFTLYAYTGWNAATYILGEVRTPGRIIPFALAAGTLAVMALYLGLNAAMLHAAPAGALAGQLNVAQVAAQGVFGQGGGRLVAGIIALGLISSISAMAWAGPRVAMVIGEDHPHAFGWLRWRTAAGIPAAAVLGQSLLTLLLLFTSAFEQVLVYTQFSLLTCSFLTVSGVIVYRFTQPDLPRPFRVPLYPLTPLLFLAISAFALIDTAAAKPSEALLGALTLLGGLGIYAVVSRGKNRSGS